MGWGGVAGVGAASPLFPRPPPLPSPPLPHPELHARPSASSCTTVIVAARHSVQSPRATARSHRPAVAARPAPGCPSGPGSPARALGCPPARFVMPGPVAPRLPPVCHPRLSGASPCPGLSPPVHWRLALPRFVPPGPVAPRPAPGHPPDTGLPGLPHPAPGDVQLSSGTPSPARIAPLPRVAPARPAWPRVTPPGPGMFSPASACHGSPRPGTPPVVPPGPALPP